MILAFTIEEPRHYTLYKGKRQSVLFDRASSALAEAVRSRAGRS